MIRAWQTKDNLQKIYSCKREKFVSQKVSLSKQPAGLLPMTIVWAVIARFYSDESRDHFHVKITLNSYGFSI